MRDNGKEKNILCDVSLKLWLSDPLFDDFRYLFLPYKGAQKTLLTM